MRNHSINSHSQDEGGQQKQRGFMSRLKLKYATGLMIASGVFGVGQTATAAPSKTLNKNKTTKSVGKGKLKQFASRAVGKVKQVASDNFALLNKYKQELRKYGAAKLEGYQQKMAGVASWYGGYFHGRLTASGRRFSTFAHMAAHKSLPFGTLLKVTNPDNGKSIVVEILDRGPYVADRMLDLSKATADELGFENAGTAKVQAEILKMGDLAYEIEEPFTAAEMSGQEINHKIDLAGATEMAVSTNAPTSNSFLYSIGIRNLLPSIRESADAVSTSVREAVEGFRIRTA